MGAFEKSTIKSFGATKKDVDEFRRSMNDWIIFLDGSLRDAKMQVMQLSRRIAELEERIDTR